ncbi:MAG: hypothetical protein C0401_10750 [Anaerolinea sp.]|nr:hypothetical protein [Anaerolinea sp.]
MQKRHLPKPVVPVIILALAVGLYFLINSLENKNSQQLSVSGTIEAVSAVLSPEIGGRVSEVFIEEGDTVSAGSPLFNVDGAVLQAQRKIASAALEFSRSSTATADAAAATARSNYEFALAAARIESTAARSAEWRMPNPTGYTLPGGSFTLVDLITAAQTEVDNAVEAKSESENSLNALLSDPANTRFVDAEKTLLIRRFAVQSALDVLNKASLSNNSDLYSTAQTAYNDAKTALDDAQAAYDDLKKTDFAVKVLSTRMHLVLATERVQAAQERLTSLSTGEYSLKVQTAKAALHQAEAAAMQAHQAVTQAEANLALLDVQLGKLTTFAPSNGVVLTRSIQVGEVLAPGAAAITLAQLDPLTITVYIPESEFGKLSIGQSAHLTVDSFTGVVFTAAVIHIADQAEFTPRNVQTTEGRKTTVFAVKLRVANPDGKLKPGMPADIVFNNGE